MPRLRVFAVLLVVFAATGCAAHGPLLSKPEVVGGTISGIVTASGTTPVPGRRVSAVNVASGARYHATTATNGGYTIKVPTGKYKLEVELRANEALSDQPVDTDVNESDLDADRDFVITRRAQP